MPPRRRYPLQEPPASGEAAIARSAGPFEAHLREAIAVNRRRSREYAKLTNGRSLTVTLPLIASEYLLIPVARWFDRRTASYHAAGVPVLDAVFVAVGEPTTVAVSLAPRVTDLPDQKQRPDVNRQLRKCSRDRDIDAFRSSVEHELLRLTCRATDAMRRHTLESMRRVLTVLGPLEEMAKAQLLSSPVPLLQLLLRQHVWSMPAADWLDDRARPLQCQGIPVLAADLPMIAAWPENWPPSALRASLH